MKKSPGLAAVLNFFLFGAGTIYVGRRVGVGIALTIGGSCAQVAEILISPPIYNLAPTIWPFLLGGLVVLKLGLAADAYAEARAASTA
jgi:hypothetical protein